MKPKLLTAVAGCLLLLGTSLASAHSDGKRDYRGPSTSHGHDRGWHKGHPPHVRKHHDAHPHHYDHRDYRGWHGTPHWRKHYHSGHYGKYGGYRDGVTIIFRGHF